MNNRNRHGSNQSDDRAGPSRGNGGGGGSRDEDDENAQETVDNWDLWAKIHSNRGVRLKLLCRDPDERTPVGSTSVVVRKLPLDATKDQISHLFHRAGAIKSIYIPKIAPHFTTKYCFIVFHDFRQADRAVKFFNGYQWNRDRLQVVGYDPCYKYRQQLVGSKAARVNDDEDQASSVVFNAIRQAEAQSESRKIRFLKETKLAESINSYLASVNAPGFAQAAVASMLRSDDTEDSANSDGETMSVLWEDPWDYCPYRGRYTVDDLLLDSEVGFENWLEGRLKFTGPLLYMDRSIGRALRKTPEQVQLKFVWLLGALRCLNDGQRFTLVGPFICLSSHEWCAEEKCVVFGFDVDNWYTEEWEPMAPNTIDWNNALIMYARCMLDRFGPLHTDDIKLQQFIACLQPSVLNDYARFGGDGDGSMVKQLIDVLVGSGNFHLADGTLYLTDTNSETLSQDGTQE